MVGGLLIASSLALGAACAPLQSLGPVQKPTRHAAVSNVPAPTPTLLSLSPNDGVVPEPIHAAEFVAAFARGDEVAADRVASPLYRAEWSLRDVSIEDRLSILPHPAASNGSATDWARFTYVNGFVDGGGFGHLLYAALATAGGDHQSPSLWRVDTDPDGKVIWNEMVWLCSDRTTSVAPIDTTTSASDIPVPAMFASSVPWHVLGVRSTRGNEGYYAVALRNQPSRQPAADAAPPTMFFAVDGDGQIRIGAWTYGRDFLGRAATNRKAALLHLGLDTDESALMMAYLSSLV